MCVFVFVCVCVCLCVCCVCERGAMTELIAHQSAPFMLMSCGTMLADKRNVASIASCLSLWLLQGACIRGRGTGKGQGTKGMSGNSVGGTRRKARQGKARAILSGRAKSPWPCSPAG